uniref:Reverse transcriptase domain-containing protein n=1 Tax=Haemonchus contortus TaxID=6289 RepID=A0A7I4XVS1_HAECO
MALLDAGIADRRRQKSFCIRGIVFLRKRLRSELCMEAWQRISSENQRICSFLREDQKCHFERKLYLLRSRQRSFQQPHFITANAVPPTRHVVIGTNEVDNDMAAVLNLGPSFAITPRVNSQVLDAALYGVHQFAYQLRCRAHRGPTVLDQQATLMSLMPFKGKFIRIPPSSREIDSKVANLKHKIQRIYRNAMNEPYRSNLIPAERRGVKKLLQAKNVLRYTVGDKCGSFVVMPQTMDKALTAKVLSDDTVYEESTSSAFELVCKRVKSVMSIVKKRTSPEMAKRLYGTVPSVPTLYNLVKTHKIPATTDTLSLPLNEIKTRPIIASCGGLADGLSWLLVRLLSPLLRYVGAHIVNVEEFILSLHQCSVPKEAFYASFDVVSLYTNVNNAGAVQAVLSLIENNEDHITMMGFSASEIKDLIEAALECNIFCFDNKFYKQKRGLAMGNRIAPVLAVIFLDHIEKSSLTSGILFYKRYIDDVFVIGTTEEDLVETLKRLNSHDANITFTREDPGRDGFLPFLNTKVRISEGYKEHLWYRKSASSNILLHSRSAHPVYMKANVVRNLLQTKRKLGTRRDSVVDAKVESILNSNGYFEGNTKTWVPYRTADGVSLILPFVNDKMAREVNHIVKNSELPIRLVFRPPPTLKDFLTSSRIYEKRCREQSCRYCTSEKICELQGTVYLIQCGGCGEKYVGETARPLKIRLDEHRRALANPAAYPNSSFSRHRTLKHEKENAPSFDVRVLHRYLVRPLERKIMEAREIYRIKPEINAKEEMRDLLRLIE